MTRLPEIEFQRAPRLHLRVHLGLEEPVGAAPVGLGAVHREVGVLQELVGLGAVGGRHGDADAGVHRKAVAFELAGLPERLMQPLGKLGDGGGIRAMSVCTMANSSPPSRATMSVSRTQDLSRAATVLSSSSPP